MVFHQNKWEKSLYPEKGKQYKDIYDFNRLWRIKQVQDMSVRYVKNLDAQKNVDYAIHLT